MKEEGWKVKYYMSYFIYTKNKYNITTFLYFKILIYLNDYLN